MGSEKRESTIKRLLWLLKTIYEAGPKGIKREDVSRKWCEYIGASEDTEYAEKTFHNHITDIKNVFNIIIKRTGHKYHISSFTDNLELSALSIWMDYMTVKDTISNYGHLRERIFIGSVYCGSDRIPAILNAMNDSIEIVIKYRKAHYTVRPYLLRFYRQRWYMIGHCLKLNGIHIFPFSAIIIQAPTDKEFEMPVMDMTKYNDDAEFLKLLNSQKKK